MSDTTQDTATIRTPLPLLMRRVRYQIVPICTLILCTALAGWLWYRRGGSVTAIGSVSALQLHVNAKIDGLLVNLPADRKVEIFQTVNAGEILARLDSSHIEAQIQRETDRLNTVRKQIELLNKPRPKSATTRPSASPLPSGADTAVPQKGAAARAALVVDAAAGADQDLDETLSNPLMQNRFSLEMLAQNLETKITELEQRILAQDIKAPISGTIVAIHRYPGQAVTAGQEIMTVASDKADYIVTYVRQTQIIQPTEKMPVNVHFRSAPRTLRSYVLAVGPAVEKIPADHLRDPRVLEWGLPVHIAIPHDPTSGDLVKLRPGELVDLFFRPHDTPGT